MTTCLRCGAPPAPRGALCAECFAAGWAYCNRCGAVEQLSAFVPVPPSSKKRGARYGKHKACRRKGGTHPPPPPPTKQNARQRRKALARFRRIALHRENGESWQTIAAMLQTTPAAVQRAYYTYRGRTKARRADA